MTIKFAYFPKKKNNHNLIYYTYLLYSFIGNNFKTLLFIAIYILYGSQFPSF